MLGNLLLLAIVIFGICIMFGIGKMENFYKFLIWLVVAPVVASIAYCNVALWWHTAPLWKQILIVLFAPFFIAASLRAVFPKAKWLQTFLAVIFQALIYIVSFPVRFLWRTGRFVLQRERHGTARLNPYRPIVGGRPPLINRQEKRENQSNLFD